MRFVDAGRAPAPEVRLPSPSWSTAALTSLLLFVAVLLAPSTTAGAVTTAASPSPPQASLVSGTPPSPAVRLGPNSDIQGAVNAYPPGSAFLLTTGLYSEFTVVPKSDDSFYAQSGVVLDGDNQINSAFKDPLGQPVGGVRIIGPSTKSPLVIEDYGTKSHSQIAAVQSNTQSASGTAYSDGWRLQWLEVTDNMARGISLSNQMLVIQCVVTDNGRLGIGGGGNGVTIADSTVDDNGVNVAHKGWEAGGIKTVAHNVLIERNTIAGNGAPGVWTDGGATGVVITHNQLSANKYGVQVEISRNVAVTSNAIDSSEQQAVLVVGSDRVAVSGNAISDNHQGIIVGGATRTGPAGIRLDDVQVSHNDVDDSGGSGLHQPVSADTTISFDWDHYVDSHFQWNGQPVTFATLQSMGQELHGTSQG